MIHRKTLQSFLGFNFTNKLLSPEVVHGFNIYRRLSLSQSPGDQTKYFEISVVRDSQALMSFTFFMYMYVELYIACTCISQLCKYPPEGYQSDDLHICVYGSEIKEMSQIAHCVYILKKCLWSMPVLHAVSSSLFVKHTYQLHTISPAHQSRLIVVYIKDRR